MAQVLSVIGQSDSGKTTTVVALVKELKRRGLRIATIKHDVHGFDIDVPGKDTWQHGQAGSDIVTISSPEKIAMIERVENERTLDEICGFLADRVDLIITEGYKREKKTKIETVRESRGSALLSKDEELLAVVADCPVETTRPVFSLADINKLADMVEAFAKRDDAGLAPAAHREGG